MSRVPNGRTMAMSNWSRAYGFDCTAEFSPELSLAGDACLDVSLPGLKDRKER